VDQAQEQIIFEVQQSIEVWRSTRQGRERLPEELWCQAISLCSFLAPTRVCKILGINYPGLRKRLRRKRVTSGTTALLEKEPLFLSLPDGLGKEPSQVRVEVSRSSSARMSLELSTDHLERLFPLALRVLEIPEK